MRSKSSERSHRRQSAKTAADPPTTVATTTATTHTSSSPSAIEAAVEASGARFNLGDLVICRYSTYPYWPATIDMTHQKKYHRKYRCLKRTHGGDLVLAYWCTFSNDDTGGWVRYDRIVPYHPKILEPIKIPRHLELGQDQYEALKVARGAYYNIPAQVRPSQPENLPKDFYSKPKPNAQDPDMLVSDEEDEPGAADDTVTSGPSNEEPNDNDDDDMDDRKSEEGDRGSVDRNNSRDKRTSVNVKANSKNDNVEDEINGSSQKPFKVDEDHAGDTNSKVDNRRRHSDSGDEYSVDHAEDDGGEDPMDLGDPSSDEDAKPPPPPPRPTKQKRESSGRGGRGRGRGGGRRASGAKRKLPTGNTTATASSPSNMHVNTSAVSTPISKRARSGTSKANMSEKGDEAIVNMGRGARRREQQREVDQLRSELSAARKVITDLKGELVKSNSIIADLKSRRVKMNPPEAPDSVPLVKPPKSEYQSKPVSSTELKDVMMKLKNTFQTFKTKVRDAQNKRAAVIVRADEMCKEFLEGCDDLEDKESKAVNLESELVDMLSHLITLDIDVMELRPLKMGRLVRSIGRTCKQMPAIHGLAEEIHFMWKAVVDKSMKKDISAGSQSDSGDDNDAEDQSGDENDSDEESNDSDSGSEEEEDGDKDDDDEDDEKEKDDAKMEDIHKDRKGGDVDDDRTDKNKSESMNDDDGGSESDDNKNKAREEDDDETVPDGSKGKSDSEKRVIQPKAEDKLEKNSKKDQDVKERDKPSAVKIEEQEEKVSATDKNERDDNQGSDEENAGDDRKVGKPKKQELKDKTSKPDKEELEKDTKMKDVLPNAAAKGDNGKKVEDSGPVSKDRKRKTKSSEVKTKTELAKDSDGYDDDNDDEKRATVGGKERKGKTHSTLNGDTAAKKLLVRGKGDGGDDDDVGDRNDDNGEDSRDAVGGKALKDTDKKSKENASGDSHKPNDYRKRQEKLQRASKVGDTKKSDDNKNNSDMSSHREDKVGEKRSRSNGDDDDAGRGRKAKRETIGKKQPLFRGTAN